MFKKSESMKRFLPAPGLVFGAGVGTVISVLCNFQIALGVVLGAAAGLLIALVFQICQGVKTDHQTVTEHEK